MGFASKPLGSGREAATTATGLSEDTVAEELTGAEVEMVDADVDTMPTYSLEYSFDARVLSSWPPVLSLSSSTSDSESSS
jgi:hypothetical protein